MLLCFQLVSEGNRIVLHRDSAPLAASADFNVRPDCASKRDTSRANGMPAPKKLPGQMRSDASTDPDHCNSHCNLPRGWSSVGADASQGLVIDLRLPEERHDRDAVPGQTLPWTPRSGRYGSPAYPEWRPAWPVGAYPDVPGSRQVTHQSTGIYQRQRPQRSLWLLCRPCLQAKKMSQAAMNIAATSGPMTKPLAPKVLRPPSVVISTT